MRDASFDTTAASALNSDRPGGSCFQTRHFELPERARRDASRPLRLQINQGPMPPRTRRTAARSHQAAPSLDAIPDDLLAAIMTVAGTEAIGALLLVSKRWQRVLLEDSAVFSTFVLRPCPDRLRGQEPTPEQQGAWLEGQRCFLERVTPRVHELVVEKGATIQRQANKAAAKQCQLDRQLGLLQRGSLAGLALDYVGSCSKALLAAAARAGGTSLTRLELSTRLPATAASVLRTLPTLCSLTASCDFPKDAGVLQAILTLTRLTSLTLHTLGASVETPFCLLRALNALRQLSISQFAHPPPYTEADLRRLLQRASQLELFSYKMTHMAREHAGFEVAGALVDNISLQLSGPGSDCVAATLGTVSMSSLQQALGVLLPTGRQLRALTLASGSIKPGAAEHCPSLEGLTELTFEDVECEWGSPGGVLQNLAEQAPNLARLCLHSSDGANRFNGRRHLNELPPAVESLQHLTALHISGHPVDWFNPGPYLLGLKELEVSAGWRRDALDSLQGSGLSAATALTSLTVSANKALFTQGFEFSRSQIRDRPALERGDVTSTLAHMRQLRRLALVGWQVDAAVMRLLRRTLPGLAIEHQPPIED